MLIILEGIDKSGKSTIANLLCQEFNALSIRKTYNEHLYPIDYGRASVFDWQAILDRVVLANPRATFVADRSFFTQTVYQICLGSGAHAITDEQLAMFNNYCKTVKGIKHLVVLCKSSKYELDSMVTNIRIKNKLSGLFSEILQNSGLNVIELDMDNHSLQDNYSKLVDKIRQELSTY